MRIYTYIFSCIFLDVHMYRCIILYKYTHKHTRTLHTLTHTRTHTCMHACNIHVQQEPKTINHAVDLETAELIVTEYGMEPVSGIYTYACV